MRDSKIDFLRFVGLMMIILAHIGPPAVIFQLRNFDVPLMVFISGISFKLSFKNESSYWKYVLKRIKRLVFPVWIFLSFFFILNHILLGYDITKYQIITTYALLSGIGYVWIIRVFLLVALCAPYLLKIDNKIKSNSYFLGVLLISFLIYEVFQLNAYAFFQTASSLKLASNIVFYIIPYSIIYLFGIRINSFTRKNLIVLTTVFGIIFLSFIFFFYIKLGKPLQTQLYKYPISTYYLSYAMMVSLILWQVGDKIINNIKGRLRKIIFFISQNSIWIYLWHIPFIYYINSISLNFVIEYFIVLVAAISITYIQVSIVEKLIISKLTNKRIIKNLRILFKG